MKIAFATQDLKRVDAHFGWAKNIAIYEIGPEGHRFRRSGPVRRRSQGRRQRGQARAQDRGHQGLRHPLCRRHRRLRRGAGRGQQHPSDEGQPAGRDHRSAGQAGRRAERHAAALAAQGAVKDKERDARFRGMRYHMADAAVLRRRPRARGAVREGADQGLARPRHPRRWDSKTDLDLLEPYILDKEKRRACRSSAIPIPTPSGGWSSSSTRSRFRSSARPA